jgi:phage terminase large subunit-like protein
MARIYKREIDGQDHYYLYHTSYLPEERATDPEKRHYSGWSYDGHLVATEGAMIDYAKIEEDIVDHAERTQLREIAYDRYGAGQLVQILQDEHGLTPVEVPQQVLYISPPMKTLEALVLDGRLHHRGSDDPVLSWAMSNVVARVDAKDNIYPRKERPENKIDPVVAAIMALSRAVHGEVEQTGSVYDTRGIISA